MQGVPQPRLRARLCARGAAALCGGAAAAAVVAHPQPGAGGLATAGLAAALLATVARCCAPARAVPPRRGLAASGLAAGAALAALALLPVACAGIVVAARRRAGAARRLTALDGAIAALGATALAAAGSRGTLAAPQPLHGASAAALAVLIAVSAALLAQASARRVERPLHLLGAVLPFAAAGGALAVLAARDARTLPALAVGAAVATLALGLVRAAGAFLELRGLAAAHAQARTDDLTRLANRRGFREAAERALAGRAPRQPLAVLSLDLDGFKRVNDELGHDVGDDLLRAAAGRLAAAVRPDDLPARLGGDEFAVLLCAGAEDARAVAARVRDALARPFAIHGRVLAVDASVGVAAWPADGSDLDALLRRADAEMYAAKRARHGAPVPRGDAQPRCENGT